MSQRQGFIAYSSSMSGVGKSGVVVSEHDMETDTQQLKLESLRDAMAYATPAQKHLPTS